MKFLRACYRSKMISKDYFHGALRRSNSIGCRFDLAHIFSKLKMAVQGSTAQSTPRYLNKGKALAAVLAPMVILCANAQAAHEHSVDDLFEMDIEQLLTVTVESPSKFKQIAAQAPAVISVITRLDIDNYGANSLLEILDRATSIQMTGSFFFMQNVTSMRGSYASHSDNHMLLMLNGRPMRESFTGGESFSIYTAFPIDIIKQIEIIRGPGSVLYGSSAYNGVVNIITQSASQTTDSLNLKLGSFDGKGLSLSGGYHHEDFALTTGLNYFSEQGWNFSAIDNNSQAGQFDAGEDNYALVMSGHYKTLDFNASLTRSRQDFWGSTSSWSAAVNQNQRDITSSRVLLDLGYQFDIDKSSYLNTNISFNSGDFSHYNYDSHSDNYLLESTYHLEANDSIRWLVGATAWYQDVSSSAGLRDAPVPNFSQTWWTLYGQMNYQFNAHIDWVIGAQINKVPDVTSNTVPRLGFIYKLGDKSGIKVNHGQAFRAAYGVETHFDLVICCNDDGTNRGGLRGNANLKPETITTTDIQYYRWGRNFQFNGTVFYSMQKDLIERERATDNVVDFINRGMLDSKGLELEFKYVLSSDTQLTTSYTYQTNEQKQTDVQSIEDKTLMPNHQLKLGITHQFENGINLGLFDSYFSNAKDNALQNSNRLLVNPKADAHHMISANITIPLSIFSSNFDEKSQIKIYGYNLLDEDIYQPEQAGRAINTNPLRAGRSVYVTLQWAF